MCLCEMYMSMLYNMCIYFRYIIIDHIDLYIFRQYICIYPIHIYLK